MKHDDERVLPNLLEKRSRRRAEAVPKTRSLKRTDLASMKKQDLEGSNRHNTFGTLTRHLKVFGSRLCQGCSSEGAMAATATRKILPSDFVLRFSQVAKAV